MVVTLQDPPEDSAARTFDDGQDHDGDPQQCAGDSDPGADRCARKRPIDQQNNPPGSVQAARTRGEGSRIQDEEGR